MDSFLTSVFYIFIAVWVISLCGNLIYFLFAKSDELDRIFFNKESSFSEALDDLHFLEKKLDCQFNSARNKILFYRKNAELTRRKYSYYADKIEDGFIQLYIGHSLTKKEIFSKLDQPVRWHFLLVFSFIISIISSTILYLGFILLFEFSINAIIINVFIVLLCFFFYVYIISINALFFYAVINFIMYSLGLDRSKLYKNIGILQFLTKNWSELGASNAVGARTVGDGNTYSGSMFGGYRGGSFGGGGAGGSW